MRRISGLDVYLQNCLRRLRNCYRRKPEIGRSRSHHSITLARSSSRRAETWLELIHWMIPGMPTHITMKKKIMQWKQLSRLGRYWDILQILLSVLTCGLYIAETYSTGFNEHILYSYTELIVTQFFLLDFLFNWFTAVSTKAYLTSVMTIVDILTIFPVYIGISTGSEVNIFRFIRILRLIRVLKTFRLLGGMSGLKRQLITLTLTLLSLTFMAAGIIQMVENDMKQLGFDCKYIGEKTNFAPSCDQFSNTYDDPGCDCMVNNCRAAYTRYDVRDEPTGINCVMMPFFDCFYFIVVTISTVGYGDIYPTTTASRAVMLMFIVTSAVVIPMQLKQLTQILATNSIFRKAYEVQSLEEHVVVCGHVNDKKKLDKFFREFFHPDRSVAKAPQFHIVILSPEDPVEEVRSLLVSPHFDSRVTYLIGSALSMEDLQRARVDIACAVFFLSNMEAKEDTAAAEGTHTVLRTLAVSDFNPNTQCLVEVMHSHDSDILKNSDVDIVLCVDEFKSVLLARNAVCPGLSTLVNNMFRTYGGPLQAKQNSKDHWLKEYHHGECMETYYINMNPMFLDGCGHEWSVGVEAVYLEFGCMILGLFDASSGKIHLNPVRRDFRIGIVSHSSNVIIILCPDADTATSVSKAIGDHQSLGRMMAKVLEAERKFGVRIVPKQEGTMQRAHSSRLHTNATADDAPRIQDIMMFCKLQRQNRKHRTVTKGAYSSKGAAATRKGMSATDEGKRIADCTKTDPLNTPSSSNDSTAEDHLNMYPHPSPEKNGGGSHGGAPLEIGEILHAFDLQNHIIVFGCMDSIVSFVEFADTSLVAAMDECRRSILYVGPEVPHKWSSMRKKHPEIYFLEGDMSDTATLARTNIDKAFSVVMLAHRREELDFEEDENLDFEMLFLYLKISSFIPSGVHFTVELTSGQNMGVLNSVAVRNETTRSGLGMQGTLDHDSDSVSFSAIVGKVLPKHVTECDEIIKQMKRTAKVRHHPKQTRGVFFSQFLSKLSTDNIDKEAAKKYQKLQKSVPGRRLSSTQLRSHIIADNSSSATEFFFSESAIWDNHENHYNLAIYAAGRAFVPDVVDNILCQSFFTSMTSSLCEALVCGQNEQGIFLMKIPRTFTYRYFSDLFRACLARNVLALALYRGASKTENSFMPFVFTCPPAKTVLNVTDQLFVYGAPDEIKKLLKVLSLPFERKGQLVHLGVDETDMANRRRSVALVRADISASKSSPDDAVAQAALAARMAVG